MLSHVPSLEGRLRLRRCAARDRGDAAFARVIKQQRAAMRQYFKIGRAERALEEYERLLETRRRRAEWFRQTEHWSDEPG